MDKELYARISDWFDAHEEALIEDICRIVRIPSVSDPDAEGKPFGQGCRDCMDEMLKIGREHGFYTENYDYYTGSIGPKEKDWENMIGFWNHMDVVPVGNDWGSDPFTPVRKGYFLIGRGAQDNKGPAIGVLYMMQCIRELGVDMKHQLCLFVGCDEERAMEDMAYHVKHYPTPAMSMIADCGFPVCYGEKGILEGQMLSNKPYSGKILNCEGGNASNMIPDRASAELVYEEELLKALEERKAEKRTEKNKAVSAVEKEPVEDTWDNISIEVVKAPEEKSAKKISVTAKGMSRHSAFPNGSRNAIYELASFLKGCKGLEEGDRAIFASLSYLSEEYFGANMDMSYEDEISGKTTCAATVLRCKEHHAELTFNIRYAITDTAVRLEEHLTKTAEEHGLSWNRERNSSPNYFPKEHPAVKLLTDVYNEVANDNKESFVMGGGTYARKLPNAFAYGIGGMERNEEDRRQEAEFFKPGHGGAHEPDEGLNLRLFMKAMKLYTMAIIAMNDCPLKMPTE